MAGIQVRPWWTKARGALYNTREESRPKDQAKVLQEEDFLDVPFKDGPNGKYSGLSH